MFSVVSDYENDSNKTGKRQHLSLFLKEIYIPKESISKYSFFDEKELYVKRPSIVNALLLATINEEYDIAKELKKFLLGDSTRLDDLGDLKDYILEHNININDYFDFEKEKYIYNPIDKSITKGFIYSEDEIDKVKKRI